MSYKEKWWYPKVTDSTWIEKIRSDYPENTEGKDDYDIRNKYNNGCKYENLWDHAGEAYEQFSPLADAFLKLEAENEALKKQVNELQKEVCEITLVSTECHGDQKKN